MIATILVGTDEAIGVGVGEADGGARPPVDRPETDRSCGLRQRHAGERSQAQQRVQPALQESATASAAEAEERRVAPTGRVESLERSAKRAHQERALEIRNKDQKELRRRRNPAPAQECNHAGLHSDIRVQSSEWACFNVYRRMSATCSSRSPFCILVFFSFDKLESFTSTCFGCLQHCTRMQSFLPFFFFIFALLIPRWSWLHPLNGWIGRLESKGIPVNSLKTLWRFFRARTNVKCSPEGIDSDPGFFSPQNLLVDCGRVARIKESSSLPSTRRENQNRNQWLISPVLGRRPRPPSVNFIYFNRRI